MYDVVILHAFLLLLLFNSQVFFFPCRIVFGIFFILNIVLWSKGSSACIPFTILLALLALWFGISVPLTFVGAFFGFRKRVSISIFYLFAYHNNSKHFNAIRA